MLSAGISSSGSAWGVAKLAARRGVRVRATNNPHKTMFLSLNAFTFLTLTIIIKVNFPCKKTTPMIQDSAANCNQNSNDSVFLASGGAKRGRDRGFSDAKAFRGHFQERLRWIYGGKGSCEATGKRRPSVKSV